MENYQSNINTLYRQYHDINQKRISAKDRKDEVIFAERAKEIKNQIRRATS